MKVHYKFINKRFPHKHSSRHQYTLCYCLWALPPAPPASGFVADDRTTKINAGTMYIH